MFRRAATDDVAEGGRPAHPSIHGLVHGNGRLELGQRDIDCSSSWLVSRMVVWVAVALPRDDAATTRGGKGRLERLRVTSWASQGGQACWLGIPEQVNEQRWAVCIGRASRASRDSSNGQRGTAASARGMPACSRRPEF